MSRKVIKIGDTKTEVQITHMKHSLLYFVKEVYKDKFTIPPWQKAILKCVKRSK